MKHLPSLLLAAAVGGCVTVPPPAPAPAYHALGTEPFWSLTIDQRELVFTRPEAQPVRQPRPKVIVGFAGEIYRTPRLNVNIVHAKCSDVLSDRTYPDKVQVDVDGKPFEGCGGL